MNKLQNRIILVTAIIGVIIPIAIYILQLPRQTENVDGEWQMISTIESAKMKKYIGATVKWKLFLSQNNNNVVKGYGEKISIDNRALDFQDRTKIEIEGHIEKQNLSLNFTEKGRLRETCGKFKCVVSNDTFIGTFSQTASDAKGKINAVKI